jgi:hypothetical protein
MGVDTSYLVWLYSFCGAGVQSRQSKADYADLWDGPPSVARGQYLSDRVRLGCMEGENLVGVYLWHGSAFCISAPLILPLAFCIFEFC